MVDVTEERPYFLSAQRAIQNVLNAAQPGAMNLAELIADALEEEGLLLEAEIYDRVLAAVRWPTNAEMIEDFVRIGYLDPELPVFDATYGLGVWWKNVKPAELVTNDLDEEADALHHEDFRATTWGNAVYPQIAFDPPYVCQGGVDTSTLKNYNARYGRPSARSIPGLRALMDPGLAEMWRILEPGGLVIAKCADFVWNGDLYDGTGIYRAHAVDLGFKVLDRFEHIGKAPRPQPGNRTKKHQACKGAGCAIGGCVDGRVPSVQEHAARNLSTAFIFQKPKRAR